GQTDVVSKLREHVDRAFDLPLHRPLLRRRATTLQLSKLHSRKGREPFVGRCPRRIDAVSEYRSRLRGVADVPQHVAELARQLRDGAIGGSKLERRGEKRRCLGEGEPSDRRTSRARIPLRSPRGTA